MAKEGRSRIGYINIQKVDQQRLFHQPRAELVMLFLGTAKNKVTVFIFFIFLEPLIQSMNHVYRVLRQALPGSWLGFMC